jgi:hypothetical protein
MFCDDLLATGFIEAGFQGTGFIEAGFKAKVPNQAPIGQDISQKLPEVKCHKTELRNRIIEPICPTICSIEHMKGTRP